MAATTLSLKFKQETLKKHSSDPRPPQFSEASMEAGECACVRVHDCVRACVRACMLACVCACVRMCVWLLLSREDRRRHVSTHTHTHTHKRTHTHTHTQTRTHTRIAQANSTRPSILPDPAPSPPTHHAIPPLQPLGIYQGKPNVNTLKLVAEEGGFLYR